VNGKIAIRTVSKRVDLKVKEREHLKIHGKWTFVVREVVKYPSVTTCAADPTTTAPTTT
jgi:hypothetical protein